MITLTSLSTQLNDQLFGVSFAAVPIATRTEAIRQTLVHINATFTSIYTISGLDGAVATTLPETYVSALLLGASAFILDFTIRSRFVGYHDTPEVSEKLVPWAERLKQELEDELTRCRLVGLQQSTDIPAFQVPMSGNHYEPSLDA